MLPSWEFSPPPQFYFALLFCFPLVTLVEDYTTSYSFLKALARQKAKRIPIICSKKKKLHIINKSTQFLFGLILYTIWKRFATFYLLQLACVNWTCLKKPTKICNFCPLMRILKQCSIRDCTRTSKIGSYLHNNPQPTPTHSPYRIK